MGGRGVFKERRGLINFFALKKGELIRKVGAYLQGGA